MDLIQVFKSLGAWNSKQEILNVIQKEEQKQTGVGDNVKEDILQCIIPYSQILTSQSQLNQLSIKMRFQIAETEQLEQQCHQKMFPINDSHKIFLQNLKEEKVRTENQELFENILQLKNYTFTNQLTDQHVSYLSQLIVKSKQIVQTLKVPEIQQDVEQLRQLVQETQNKLLHQLGYLEFDKQYDIQQEASLKVPPTYVELLRKLSIQQHFQLYNYMDIDFLIQNEIANAEIFIDSALCSFMDMLNSMYKTFAVQDQVGSQEEIKFLSLQQFVEIMEKKIKTQNDIFFEKSLGVINFSSFQEENINFIMKAIDFNYTLLQKIQQKSQNISQTALELIKQNQIIQFKNLFKMIQSLYINKGKSIRIFKFHHSILQRIVKFSVQPEIEAAKSVFVLQGRFLNNLQTSLIFSLAIQLNQIIHEFCKQYLQSGQSTNKSIVEQMCAVIETFIGVISDFQFKQNSILESFVIQMFVQLFKAYLDQVYYLFQHEEFTVKQTLQVIQDIFVIANQLLPLSIKKYGKQLHLNISAQKDFQKVNDEPLFAQISKLKPQQTFDSSVLQTDKLAKYLNIQFNQFKQNEEFIVSLEIPKEQQHYFSFLTSSFNPIEQFVIGHLTDLLIVEPLDVLNKVNEHLINNPQIYFDDQEITDSQMLGQIVQQYRQNRLSPLHRRKLEQFLMTDMLNNMVVLFLQTENIILSSISDANLSSIIIHIYKQKINSFIHQIQFNSEFGEIQAAAMLPFFGYLQTLFQFSWVEQIQLFWVVVKGGVAQFSWRYVNQQVVEQLIQVYQEQFRCVGLGSESVM